MTPRNPTGGFPQLLLDVHEELIVDLFAGGGGASLGIEMATGRQVDVAVNHDPAAIAMHEANHPQTYHLRSDVFDVDPREVTGGRPVGLLWASPDCTYHSKARGGKPIRSAKRKRRSLAWVVTRWAGQVRPRVICLENVEEFAGWGPLVGPPDQLRPCSRRRGKTFRAWVRSLERHGYVVEWRELRACDFGAPTIRKRLYLIARCDGGPIVWPEPTHGPGTQKRYRSAAECIDWSIPMLSIFATKEEARVWGKAHRLPSPRRPLADATLRRIARGVVRYVLESPRPFLVPVQNASGNGVHDAGEPLRTITAHPKGGGLALAAPFLVPRYGERDGQEPRARAAGLPHPVVVPTANGASLVAAFLAKHFTGVVGSDLRDPKGTVTAVDHDGLVAVDLERATDRPDRVASFLQAYYGQGIGQSPEDPALTIPTKDRLGLVTVQIRGERYVLADIAMRMLQPRELYRAQGFPDHHRIDQGPHGRRLTKTEQVRMVGNSVCPPVAAALVAANCADLVARDEALARRFA